MKTNWTTRTTPVSIAPTMIFRWPGASRTVKGGSSIPPSGTRKKPGRIRTSARCIFEAIKWSLGMTEGSTMSHARPVAGGQMRISMKALRDLAILATIAGFAAYQGRQLHIYAASGQAPAAAASATGTAAAGGPLFQAELRLLPRPGRRRWRNRAGPYPVKAGNRGCGRRQDRGCGAAWAPGKRHARLQQPIRPAGRRSRRIHP